MKSHVLALAVVLLVAAAAGCASVDMGTKLNGMDLATSGTDVAHVNAESWGIYFLPMFPLLTGDTSSTAGGMAVLSDTCNVEAVVDMATKKAKELGGGGLYDLQSNRTSFPIIPPFIIMYKSVQVSGNVVK
ncbi:MAG: hypothetical protein ABIF82_12430 [Planctomycetota bacterium]